MDFRTPLERALEHKKVLVVDDYLDVRKSMRKMMEQFGARHVDEAANGEKALDLMRQHEYDIILCDYNLGDGKDGQQVLEEAKLTDLISYSCAYMMVTAENNMGMVMGAIEYMPDDYLQKPFTREVLKPRIERLLKKKSELVPVSKLVKQGDISKAIALINELVKTSNNVVELLRIKTELSFRLEAYVEVKEFLHEVMEKHNVPWAKLGLGKAHYYLGEYDDAFRIFLELIGENHLYVHAYDWLASTFREMDRNEEAQEVLMAGAARSPKSILRQRSLGELAYENKDMDVASKSFRAAVSFGNNSALRKADEFTGLAKVLSNMGLETDALKVISNATRVFKESPEALFQTGMIKSAIYHKQGLKDAAKDVLADAQKHIQNIEGKSMADAATELADMCMDLGAKDSAVELLAQVVRNNHEDPNALGKVQDIFNKVGLGEEGERLIEENSKQMTLLNNKGVQMVKDGQLNEAVSVFVKAAKGAPENVTINLNAAQSLLMLAEQEKDNALYLKKAKEHLDNVKSVGARSEKYSKLLLMYEGMTVDQGNAATG